MHSIILFTAAFAALAVAQSSMPAVSQISEGQVQATGYSNPFTSYLAQTNSLGVVTGMPSVVTSQPAVVFTQPSVITSQATVATFVPTAPGIPAGLNTTLVPVASVPVVSSPIGNLSTSAASATAAPSGSAGAASGSSSAGFAQGSSTSTRSAARASATSGAVAHRITQMGVGLGIAGTIFAAFL